MPAILKYIIECVIGILAIFLTLGILFLSCRAAMAPPEITGEPDDGLWLYKRGTRWRTDMKNPEYLVTEVEYNGIIYDNVYYYDTLYCGDSVFLCMDYYEGEDPEMQYTTSFIVEHDLKTKNNTVIYNCNESMNILFVSSDKSRIAVQTDSQKFVLKDGQTESSCEASRRMLFSDEYVAYYVGVDLYYKTWTDEDWAHHETRYIDDALNDGNILYLRSSVLLDGTGDYFDRFEIFDMADGRSVELNSPKDGTSCLFDHETGCYALANISGDGTRTGGYKMYKFDKETFTSAFVADFPATDADLFRIESHDNYIELGGYDAESDYKTIWFDAATGQFLQSSPLPERKILGEFGDYYFYCSEKSAGFFGGPNHALHRVKKSTGKDDVMAVIQSSDEPYIFDAILDY